jgi:hypothetical protein
MVQNNTLLHCRILGSIPVWHTTCASQLWPFLYIPIVIFPFCIFLSICMKKIKSWNLNYRFCILHTAFNFGTKRLSTGTSVQFLLKIVWNEGMSYSRWIQKRDVFAWPWVIRTFWTLSWRDVLIKSSILLLPLLQQQSKTRGNCNLESFTAS